MVHERRTFKAGKKMHTQDSKISRLTKLLFQILQCVHHLSNIGHPPTEGIQTKAFIKKQSELDKFVRPAQETPDSEFRGVYTKIVNNFLLDTLAALAHHYLARLDVLSIQILKMGITPSELQTSFQIAMRWGRKNFRSKLSRRTVDTFHRYVEKLTSDLQSFSHSNQNCTSHQSPAQGLPPVSFPFPTSPPDSELSFFYSPSPSNNLPDHSSKPLFSPSPPSLNPSSNSQTSTKTLPSQPEPQLANKTHPPRNSYVNKSLPDKINPPKSRTISPNPSPPTNHSPKPSTSSHSTSTSTHTSPPTPSHLYYNHSLPSRDVRGATDVLSNFFYCRISFRGQHYCSAEQAYQHSKALFLRRSDVSQQILNTANPVQIKNLSKQLKNDPNFQNWENQKKDLMRELLWVKSKQVGLFRSELLKTSKSRLTHNRTDRFWGTTYKSISSNKTLQGQDVFANLLMELRDALQSSDLSVQTLNDKPLPNPPQKSVQMKVTPEPVITNNKFSPLQFSVESDDDFPPLPQQSPVTPLPQRPRRPKTNNTVSGLHTTRHTDKVRWGIPSLCSQVAVIGDSNLSRIDQVRHAGNSIEIHSFPGAKFFHINEMCRANPVPQETPTTVILSIGINSRDNKPSTHRHQLKQLVQSSSKTFPNAHIYIPQLNFSASLSETQRASLDAINQTIMELAGNSSTFGTIPKLPAKLFHTHDDGIHWTPQTANQLISHWLNHLN